MARLRRDYEWACETVDDNEDIVDVSHFDTLAEALACDPPLEPGETLQHALVVHYVSFSPDCDVDEEEGRSYAYLTDGVLASDFEDGEPVPARFIREALAEQVQS